MAEKKKAPAKRTAAKKAAPGTGTDPGAAAQPEEETATGGDTPTEIVVEVVDSATGDGPDDDAFDERPKIRLTGTEWNRAIPGVLTFHYDSRDVELPADGDSGARVLKWYEENFGGKTLDPLSTTAPVAHRGWMIFETEGLLGISWRPLHIRPQRITVDPVSRSSRHFADQLDEVEIVDAA